MSQKIKHITSEEFFSMLKKGVVNDEVNILRDKTTKDTKYIFCQQNKNSKTNIVETYIIRETHIVNAVLEDLHMHGIIGLIDINTVNNNIARAR